MTKNMRELERENKDLRQKLLELEEEASKLRESEENLTKMIRSASDAILMRDGGGEIVFWNDAAERLFGYSPEELGRLKLDVLFADPERGVDFFGQAGDSFASGGAVEMAALAKDGRRFPVELTLSPFMFKGKWRAIMIVRDVSVRKEAEKALKKAKEEAEALGKVKSEFLTSVSHELRTPLTAINGFMKIIRKRMEKDVFPVAPVENPAAAKAVDQVRSNISIVISQIERISALVNDVLDLANLEDGRVEWRMGPADPQELFSDFLDGVAPIFEEKGLELAREISPDLPQLILDRRKILQVLDNLFSNAFKFTRQGGATFRAEPSARGVMVSISDTGRGISDENMSHLFEKFRQIGDTLTDKPAGTGLGLAICKKIIEGHGGRIWAESVMGRGSSFSFELPLRGPEQSGSS